MIRVNSVGLIVDSPRSKQRIISVQVLWWIVVFLVIRVNSVSLNSVSSGGLLIRQGQNNALSLCECCGGFLR